MEDKFVKYAFLLFGSWYSVIFHTLFFVFLLFYSKNLLFFNTFVSIEAIYIGIFILMAASREERVKDKKILERRQRDRQLVKEDVTITNEVLKEIKILNAMHLQTQKKIDKITRSSTTTPLGDK